MTSTNPSGGGVGGMTIERGVGDLKQECPLWGVGGVWIFSGTTHCSCFNYILHVHVLSFSQ